MYSRSLYLYTATLILTAMLSCRGTIEIPEEPRFLISWVDQANGNVESSLTTQFPPNWSQRRRIGYSQRAGLYSPIIAAKYPSLTAGETWHAIWMYNSNCFGQNGYHARYNYASSNEVVTQPLSWNQAEWIMEGPSAETRNCLSLDQFRPAFAYRQSSSGVDEFLFIYSGPSGLKAKKTRNFTQIAYTRPQNTNILGTGQNNLEEGISLAVGANDDYYLAYSTPDGIWVSSSNDGLNYTLPFKVIDKEVENKRYSYPSIAYRNGVFYIAVIETGGTHSDVALLRSTDGRTWRIAKRFPRVSPNSYLGLSIGKFSSNDYAMLVGFKSTDDKKIHIYYSNGSAFNAENTNFTRTEMQINVENFKTRARNGVSISYMN